MITIKLSLDKRRAKKDGSFPLVFRINCDGATRDIPTGYSLKENHWDEANHQLLKSSPSNKIIAPRLKELESNYLLKIIEFERINPGKINVQDLKDHLTSNKNSVTHVRELWLRTIDNLNKTHRHGGARVYKQSLSVLEKVTSLDIPFEKVDYSFLKRIETTMLARGLKKNSTGVYFRSFRAIYNQAINEKLIDYSNYPFRAFKIKRERTLPQPVTRGELTNYFQVGIDQKSPLYESWLIGKLIFLLAGINVADLFQLTESNVREGRVIYFRSKTKKMYSVRLLPEAEKILSYFKSKGAKTLLGRLTDLQIENKHRIPYYIHQRNKKLNQKLAKIGELIDCKKKITSYTFRYTIANLCKQEGYSVQLIAELLGHSYGSQITGVYLEAYDKELLDEMHERICSMVINWRGN